MSLFLSLGLVFSIFFSAVPLRTLAVPLKQVSGKTHWTDSILMIGNSCLPVMSYIVCRGFKGYCLRQSKGLSPNQYQKVD